MAKSTNQKAKILYLEKILQGTDETHPCTMQEILGRLQEYGISAERKSIYDDMEVLRSFGMDIKFKRGKSTGYYVTGQKAATEALADGVREERSQTAAVEIPEAADAAEMPPVQKNSRPDWLLPFSDSEDDKPVKLFYSSKRKDEITEALGNCAQYKEKESGTFTAAFYAEETPQFFGWLAGLGRDAVIVKPKKAVQAYRDYLKGILKEYK